MLAIVLFSALSLASVGPHPWDDQTPPGHALAISRDLPACPLCDFAAHSPLAPTPPPAPTVAPAIAPAAIPPPMAVPHSRFAPRRVGRAPPSSFV